MATETELCDDDVILPTFVRDDDVDRSFGPIMIRAFPVRTSSGTAWHPFGPIEVDTSALVSCGLRRITGLLVDIEPAVGSHVVAMTGQYVKCQVSAPKSLKYADPTVEITANLKGLIAISADS